uniref:Protein kinase domain-containing protein n=1 Tax=Spongospora subterranea TaxID=70186 RepID=A0A0H5R587_9EUKA|eukprot:CRZ09325.1 hypothetical protein [Spongospora subterranea]
MRLSVLVLKAFRSFVSHKNRRYNDIENEYEIDKRIDKNVSMNIVRLGRHKKTGDIVAVKSVLKKSRIPSDQEEIVFKQMAHPSLVQLIDVFEDKKCVYFVMERCMGGDLVDLIEAFGGKLNQDVALTVFKQLVEAVNFMHSKAIVHSDLKPSNIMVSMPDLTVKVIDFGASHIASSSGGIVPATQGSPEFMAPETIERSEIGFKSDIWALGVILFIMLMGFSPFNPCGKPYVSVQSVLHCRIRCGFSNVIKKGFGAFFPETVHVSSEMRSLLVSLLSFNPDDRPSTEMILAHPLLKNHVQIQMSHPAS